MLGQKSIPDDVDLTKRDDCILYTICSGGVLSITRVASRALLISLVPEHRLTRDIAVYIYRYILPYIYTHETPSKNIYIYIIEMISRN